MSRLKFIVIAAAFALPVAAHAADMPGLPLPSPMSEVIPANSVEWSSGWYIRGDIGYRFDYGIDSAMNDIGATSPTTNSIDKSYSAGLGFGYKNKWFRTDITGDYNTRTDYVGSNGALTQRQTIDGYTVLGNVYLDLGTWWGITPYVGGGAGGSRLTTQNYSNGVPGITAPPTSEWSFSWAYMAGVSFQVMPSLLIDVGYRHLNLGDALGGPTANRLMVNKIETDEIRIGLRYTLD